MRPGLMFLSPSLHPPKAWGGLAPLSLLWDYSRIRPPVSLFPGTPLPEALPGPSPSPLPLFECPVLCDFQFLGSSGIRAPGARPPRSWSPPAHWLTELPSQLVCSPPWPPPSPPAPCWKASHSVGCGHNLFGSWGSDSSLIRTGPPPEQIHLFH